MTPTEQQNAALAAFVACVVAKLNPSLNAHTERRNGKAEYEVLIGAGSAGVIHDQIEAVLRIATDHGGRAFIDTRDLHRTDAEWKHGRLCIVWPPTDRPIPGPGDLSEQEQAEVAKRGGKVARPPAPAKRARKRSA